MIANGTSGGFTREMEAIAEDHLRIFDAIASADAPRAAEAMRDHLLVSARALVVKETGDAASGAAFEPLFPEMLLRSS